MMIVNRKRVLFLACTVSALVLIGVVVFVLLLAGGTFRITAPFTVLPEELLPETSDATCEDLSVRFLTLESDIHDWFTVSAVMRLREHFNRVYPLLCEIFNSGVMVKIRYRLDTTQADRAAFVCEGDHDSGMVIAINPGYFRKDETDFSLLSCELTRALLDCVDAEYGAPATELGGVWVIDGIAEYGRYLCERESYEFIPFSKEQSYADSGAVTVRFFVWLCDHYEATFMDQLIEGLRCEPYTPKLFVKITGYTVDELWKIYAASNHGDTK